MVMYDIVYRCMCRSSQIISLYFSLQEFLAYGIMNIIGSFFSSFTAAGSLSRSSVQSNAGGKTQLVGLISAVIIVIVLVALGPLFFDLPKVSPLTYSTCLECVITGRVIPSTVLSLCRIIVTEIIKQDMF